MSALSLNGILQKALLSLDPQVSSFDRFYQDFIDSPLSQFFKDYHGEPYASYNLMGKNEYIWLKNYIHNLKGNTFELGCGLSPVATILRQSNKLSHYTGTDFSSSAIDIMKKRYPQGHWTHGHYTFLKIPKFDNGLSIDASYDQKNLFKIVGNCNKSFLISRIHSPESFLPRISGHTKKEIDFTSDYQELIISWIDFLSSFQFNNFDIKMTISWKVIYNEMQRHLSQLNKDATLRTVTIYDKNI